MKTLYKHTQKREENRMVFEGMLAGVDLREAVESKEEEPAKERPVKSEGWFKDPKEYEEMSTDERDKETQKLMNLTKQWDASKPFGGKKPKGKGI